MSKDFGEYLRTKLSSAGTKEALLTKAVGCNRSHLNRILNGKREPGKDFIAKVADSLGLDGDERVYLTLLGNGYSPEEAKHQIALISRSPVNDTGMHRI